MKKILEMYRNARNLKKIFDKPLLFDDFEVYLEHRNEMLEHCENIKGYNEKYS